MIYVSEWIERQLDIKHFAQECSSTLSMAVKQQSVMYLLKNVCSLTVHVVGILVIIKSM